MWKLFVTVLVLLSLTLSGCAQMLPSSVEPVDTSVDEPVDEREELPGGETEETPTNGEAESEVVLPEEPPEDMTWISPGKVVIGNFHPGARAEWDITIHNGELEERSFEVMYRAPDRIKEGYWPPPEVAQDWVIIADPAPILASRETRDILIVLEMPVEAGDVDIESVDWVPPKWEFWISIRDVSQTGMVVTELCSRWLVAMR